MTGIRVELANPETYASPGEYVEQHLAPVVTELHRITNELLSPGATSAEEWSVDMRPETPSADWRSLDRRLEETAKHVTFDGSQYFTLPAELLRAKQLKVQLTAVVYGKPVGKRLHEVEFRLSRADGIAIDNSTFCVTTTTPVTINRILPFGGQVGSIAAELRDYVIEARCVSRLTVPVCRRLSLSFVYV
jgi:hypothetical protein